MTIIEAIEDEKLIKPLFKNLSTWNNWLFVLKAIFGLEMTDEERTLFTSLTGRETPPVQQVQDAWLICGRRSGKSRMAALIAAFLSCFKDYRQHLAPGERITIMVLACDRRQARTIFRYALGMLEQVPMLQAMIDRRDAESISLSNRVDLEITTNNFRSVRGFTIGAAILHEVAYWRSEFSANPDEEVLNAIKPAMATVPNALLIGIGCPYRRSGVLYDPYKRYHAKEETPVLVIQASSQQLNPTIPDSVIARAMETDPVAAQAEWFATFRSDLAAFLDFDVIERAIEAGRRERAPRAGVTYTAFVDCSSGRRDSFALAIGHRNGQQLVLDVLRDAKAPCLPYAVLAEFAALLKTYRCYGVQGDGYAIGFVEREFAKQAIRFTQSDLSKSKLYLEALPLFNAGLASLLDYQPLTLQLIQLERATHRSGKDSVDHPPQGHDDLANSACGCLAVLASSASQEVRMVKLVGY